MGFITGFIFGIIFTLIVLLVFAKPITNFAVKRGMQGLVTGIQGQVEDLAESMNIPIETDPDKIIEEDKDGTTKSK